MLGQLKNFLFMVNLTKLIVLNSLTMTNKVKSLRIFQIIFSHKADHSSWESKSAHRHQHCFVIQYYDVAIIM